MPPDAAPNGAEEVNRKLSPVEILRLRQEADIAAERAGTTTRRLTLASVFNPTLTGPMRETLIRGTHKERVEAARTALEAGQERITEARIALQGSMNTLPQDIANQIREIDTNFASMPRSDTEFDFHEFLRNMRSGLALSDDLNRSAFAGTPAVMAFQELLASYQEPTADYSVAYIQPTRMVEKTGQPHAKDELGKVLRVLGFGVFGLIAAGGAIMNLLSKDKDAKNWILPAIYGGLAYGSLTGFDFFGDKSAQNAMSEVQFLVPNSSFERGIITKYQTYSPENRGAFGAMAKLAAGNEDLQDIEHNADECRIRLLAATGASDISALPLDVQQFLKDDLQVKNFVSTLRQVKDPQAKALALQFFEEGMGPNMLGKFAEGLQ